MPRKAPQRERSERPEDADSVPIPILPRHRFALDITAHTYERAVGLLGAAVFGDPEYRFGSDDRPWINETHAFLAQPRPEQLNLGQIAQLFYDRIRGLRSARNQNGAFAGQNDLLHIEDILAIFHAFMNFEDTTAISILVKESGTRGLIFALASLAHHVFYDDPATYPFAKFKSDFVEAWELNRREAEARRSWGGHA